MLFFDLFLRSLTFAACVINCSQKRRVPYVAITFSWKHLNWWIPKHVKRNNTTHLHFYFITNILFKKICGANERHVYSALSTKIKSYITKYSIVFSLKYYCVQGLWPIYILYKLKIIWESLLNYVTFSWIFLHLLDVKKVFHKKKYNSGLTSKQRTRVSDSTVGELKSKLVPTWMRCAC